MHAMLACYPAAGAAGFLELHAPIPASWPPHSPLRFLVNSKRKCRTLPAPIKPPTDRCDQQGAMAEAKVLALLKESNKPYNVQSVADMLATQGVKKAAADKALAALAEAGKITCKVWKRKSAR